LSSLAGATTSRSFTVIGTAVVVVVPAGLAPWSAACLSASTLAKGPIKLTESTI
jgi:hypothetical protein